MCGLCSKDPKERNDAMLESQAFAEQLRTLAAKHYQLSAGTIKPHSKDMDKVRQLSKSILIEIVNSWL